MRTIPIFRLVMLSIVVSAIPACKTPIVIENGHPSPTVTPTSIAIENLVGYLDIDAAKLPDQTITHGSESVVGWVFVNGGIVEKIPFQQRRILVPATYEVRVVLVFEGPNGVSYSTVSWPRITIEQGRNEIIKTEKVLNDWLMSYSKQDGLDYYQRNATLWTPPTVMLNSRTPERLNEASNELAKAAEDFTKSDEWKAVSSAADQLRLSPPSRPRVWVELPLDLGGPREMDAEQLRLLSKCITPRLGGWAAPMVYGDAVYPVSEDEQLRLRQLIGQLSARAQSIQESVKNVIDAMIAALNKAQGT